MDGGALAQRAILTAVAETRLVGTDGEVMSATIGSAALVDRCSTVVDAGRAAHLHLVLGSRDDVDYGQTAACVEACIAELDSLSGRESTSRRCSAAHIRATVAVYIGRVSPGAAVPAAAAGSVSPRILDQALGRNAVDRMLGVRDLRRASLEQRVNFLLALGQAEKHRPWLNETMSRSGTAELCAIEELGTMAIEEHCCATGCEPCVWETYYQNQARERRTAHAARKRPRAEPLDAVDRRPVPSPLGGRGEGGRVGGSESGSAAASVAASEGTPPRLRPDEMVTIALVERSQHTADMVLLTFGASLGRHAPSPWHVRLQLDDLSGRVVTRAYTALRCADGKLELLVKVHPEGRCSQALARLRVGEQLLARGPIATDSSLHELLLSWSEGAGCRVQGAGRADSPLHERLLSREEAPRPAPCTLHPAPPPSGGAEAARPPARALYPAPCTALHCLSGGSGISPMYQMADALLARLEGPGAARAAPREGLHPVPSPPERARPGTRHPAPCTLYPVPCTLYP